MPVEIGLRIKSENVTGSDFDQLINDLKRTGQSTDQVKQSADNLGKEFDTLGNKIQETSKLTLGANARWQLAEGNILNTQQASKRLETALAAVSDDQLRQINVFRDLHRRTNVFNSKRPDGWLMATAFLDPDNMYPTRDTSDVQIDGNRRTIQELTGATPSLTVVLGATAQLVNCVWFGVANVAKATISLDGTVIVSAETYPEKKGFASFPEQPVTEITLAVTEKEDNSQPVRISEVVAGKVLLELPNQVFLPNTTPQPALRIQKHIIAIRIRNY